MEAKDIFEEIYNRFQEQMPCSADDIAIRREKKKLDALIGNTDNESAILDYGIAYEKAGFRFGFTLAVRIMAQCMDEVTVSMP